MKTKITILFLFICAIVFAQENEYERVILDGKEASLNLKTGTIRLKKPKSISVTQTEITSSIIETRSYNDSNSSSFTHAIKKGETLYALSRQYKISVREICNFNNISQSLDLKIGQVLSIPNQVTLQRNINKSDSHLVEKGETLYAISRKYNLSVNHLKQLNNLNSNNIIIHQKLKIK